MSNLTSNLFGRCPLGKRNCNSKIITVDRCEVCIELKKNKNKPSESEANNEQD